MGEEADVKRKIVKEMKAAGSYGRRIEDAYGVGIFDMILIPFGLPVFMTEVKVVKGETFGPTMRQQVELERIRTVGATSGHVIPLMLGYKNGIYYFHPPAHLIAIKDCFSVTTSEMPFPEQLIQYYHSRRK